MKPTPKRTDAVARDESKPLGRQPEPPAGAGSCDYTADLRSDLQKEEYRLKYLSACAKEGQEALRVGIRNVVAALGRTAGEPEQTRVRLDEHKRSCVYCNQGNFSGCDRGRELAALAAPVKPSTGAMSELKIPSLWRIERCTRHEDYFAGCALCEEEVLTCKTENAYRAGFAAALATLTNERAVSHRSQHETVGVDRATGERSTAGAAKGSGCVYTERVAISKIREPHD